MQYHKTLHAKLQLWFTLILVKVLKVNAYPLKDLMTTSMTN